MKQVFIKTIDQKEIGRIKLPKGISILRYSNTIKLTISSEIKDCISNTSILLKFKDFFNISNIECTNMINMELSFKIDKEVNQINLSKHGNYNTWTFYTTEIKEVPVTNKLDGMSAIIDIFAE